jgi:uncharacterized protein YodC (DUF2158 family)
MTVREVKEDTVVCNWFDAASVCHEEEFKSEVLRQAEKPE